MVVSGTVVFDSLGRVVEQDQPTFFGGMNYAYVPNLSRKNPTSFTYDTLDRTTSVTTPDKAKTTTLYGFGALGGGALFKTTVTDPLGHAKESYKDIHDRILAVVEYNKGAAITTTYAYNIMNEITNVTDDKGNPTTIVYDLLGHRRSIDNKDTGNTLYTYDANGNVTTKETANLRTGAKKINYTYDYNRLATIDYPDSIDVSYEYGDPTETGDQKGNLAGRIKQVTDESGTELRYYGRLGETVKELKQVNAQNNPVAKVRYETRYVFDSFGRMQQMTYPDGEVLYYVYDHGGLLKEAKGLKRGNKYDYIKSLLYNEFGQRTALTYGNNVATTYTYNSLNLRLTNLKSVEPTKGRVVQNIAYAYDPVGNILGTNNAAPVPAGGEIGGPTVQDFVYDDLYQLTTAVGYHLPAPGKKTQYTNNLYYDTIGNITRKLQTHLIVGSSGSTQEPSETNYVLDYKYLTNGSTRPHAVTDAGDKLYAYDNNGNMAGWTSKANPSQSRIITWNEENRVKNIADSGNGTDFVYDDTGERAIKRGGGNETVYLNRFYALKNGDLGSKHIFAGETRVCTKVEKDGGSIQSGVPGSGAFVVSQGLRNALQQGNPRAPKKGINRRLPGVAGSVAASPPIEKFEFFYHGDHLGSSNFITDDAGQVYQELEYFPYGETWVEDGGSGQMPYYRFTGKELDPETGLYYYGARYYDPVLSRWISADPFLGKYLPTGSKNNYGNLAGFGGVFNPVNINLYTYTHNNPVKFVDPDGNDVYLVIWSTHDGRIGHAGIAVTQYARDSKGNMVPTGNLRYRDLWPGQPVGRNNVSQDVPAAYGDRMVKETEIQTADVSGSEGYAPEGVIRLTTDFETDANVEGALTSFSESNSSYNGLQCNCSDFAETGVEAAIGRAVGSEETIGGQKVTTPNQLFKSTRNLPNATVLKNPGSKVDQSFLRGVTGSKMGEKAGEKKMEHMRNDTRTSE